MPGTGQPASVGDALRSAARRHPGRDAYVHGERRLTYAALDRAADGFAASLLDLGVAPGAVVVLLLPNGLEYPACYLGAARAGAVTSGVNLRLGPAERASIVGRTAPAVTVVGEGVDAPPHAGEVLRASDLPACFAAPPPAPDHLEVGSPTDPVAIVWTSGTTGVPKGAVYDHATMVATSLGMGVLTAPADRRLVGLPFPHVGYMTRIVDELTHGTTLVLGTEPWSATEHLRLIRDEAITVATGVPTQWSLVLDHPDLARTDCSHLRLAGTGAATVPPELVRRLREALGCPVVVRYTSTEAGLGTGTVPGDPDDVVAHTVGRASEVVDLRIVDPDSEAALPPGAVGEVRLRSPAMFRGYWRDPEATAAALDADGFLRTGDLGWLGDDANLRLVGRLKEMYLRGGYNVYPAEVEGVLAAHPAVASAAVVAAPDPVLGERGVAFVVPAEGAAPGSPTLEALRAWTRDHVADYKAPDRVVLVEELPVTAMMKVDKQALERRAAEER